MRPPATGRIGLSQAETAMASGDARNASRLARALLRNDPEQIGALELLAKAQWRLADYEGLLGTLAILVRLNPYEPGYLALKGAVHQAQGRIGEALRCFARADVDDPSTADAIVELRAWQETLIADLLQSDPTFRAEYEQDPIGACSARGFDFVQDFKPTANRLASAPARVQFLRPS